MTAASLARSLVWQPTQSAFWVLVICMVLSAPLQLAGLAEEQENPAVFGIALLMGGIHIGVFLVLAHCFIRRDSGPASASLSLRLLAMGWGFVVVPVIGAYANTRHFSTLNALGLHSFAASIAAPIDEDTLRFVGVLGVVLLASGSSDAAPDARRLTVLDGLALGFLVGAGFEAAENLAFALDAESIPEALRIALIRSGLGLGLHALWAGIAGAALAACLVRRRAGLAARWSLLAAGILIPMLLHAVWDAPGLSVDPRATVAVMVGVYVATIALFVGVGIRARGPG